MDNNGRESKRKGVKTDEIRGRKEVGGWVDPLELQKMDPEHMADVINDVLKEDRRFVK